MRETLDIEGTEVFIEGNGEQVIVMLHGWPDTRALWRRQIDFFQQHYTCVSFTMPGFAEGDHARYSLSDVVDKLGAIIDAVSPDKAVILLAHDWGCVFGYEYAMRHPQRVGKMIGLDVGDADSQELADSLTLVHKLMVFTYQSILAFSFILPRSLGNPVARFMAKALQARSDFSKVHAGMSMPYAMRWLGVNGGLENLLPVEPVFPFYYAYATQKPMMFHSTRWLDRLVQSPANRVEVFECSHWLMVDRADELNSSVAQWLEGK